MLKTRTISIVLALMLLVSSLFIASPVSAAVDYEYNGIIHFDNLSNMPFDGVTVSNGEMSATFSYDSGYMTGQGTDTAVPLTTSSGTKGLGLVNGQGGIQLSVCSAGAGSITNGAIRVTFQRAANMVKFTIGTSTASPGADVYVKPYDAAGNEVEITYGYPSYSPGSSVNIKTRRNEIAYVVIYSTAPFWTDDFDFGYTGNQDPFAILDAASYTGTVGVPVIFDASASYDPEGDTLTYEWSFDGGVTYTDSSSIATYTKTWDSPWEGTVTLKVIATEDERVGYDITTATVSITEAGYDNHGQYVKSVAQNTESGPGKGAAVSEAAKSDVGKKNK